MRKFGLFCSLITLALGLQACSGDVQEDLGLKRKAPDEFAVIKRAPLEVPPNYGLRPPEPGAPRPQEQSTDQQARKTVFGTKDTGSSLPTDAEAALLQQAGADKANPNIRNLVNSESKERIEDNRPVAEKLLGIVSDDKDDASASLVNAKEEAARIQKNIEEGKPVTEGETPTLDD